MVADRLCRTATDALAAALGIGGLVLVLPGAGLGGVDGQVLSCSVIGG